MRTNIRKMKIRIEKSSVNFSVHIMDLCQIKILHVLKPPDYKKRKKLPNGFNRLMGSKNLIESDEAYSHLNGAVKNHNCRIWSD